LSAAEPFPAVFDLGSLAGGDGTAGFVLTEIHEFDKSGLSVSAAGDVNGDGIGDLIIGAYWASPSGRYYPGESYVVFGRDVVRAGAFPAVLPLASLEPAGGGDGSAGFVLTGIRQRDYSGCSVSAGGDINGDGSMTSSSVRIAPIRRAAAMPGELRGLRTRADARHTLRGSPAENDCRSAATSPRPRDRSAP
jgi:hypothetical protein